MRVIDGYTIKINRGDILPIKLKIPVYIENEEGEPVFDHYYQFQVGDKIDFSVYKRRRMSKDALLLKEIIVSEEAEELNFTLTSEDMKIGPLINKPTEYWYEVELNDKQTIIGYDDKGPKVMLLYPEGSEIV